MVKGNALFLVGQELYQLSKEKADFNVTAGEEDESTAGSSGENEGNSRSSTPHSTIKTPLGKSPAKAQKPEGKMVLLGEEPQDVLCAFGEAGSGSLPSVMCSKILWQLPCVCQGSRAKLCLHPWLGLCCLSTD